MAKYTSKHRSALSRRTILLVVIFLLLAAAAFGTYWYRLRKQPTVTTGSAPVTTAANNEAHKTTSSSTFNQGGAIDNKGVTPSTPNATSPSEWKTSASGVITLQQPTANTLVKSGDTLSGTSKTDTIQYRLVDDQSGVIAQGTLSVVGGKFSGTLQFSPHSTSGSLKVFTLDPQSGTEINHADITIKLSP